MTTEQSPHLILPLIARYREAMRARGLSRAGMKTWCAWLRTYQRFAGSDSDLRDFHIDPLKSWLLALSNRGLRPRTRRSAIAALRSFGDWLVREGMLATNPALGLVPPKLDAARRELCTDDEVRALLDACDRLASLRRAALGRCVMQILACAALRRCELLALQVGDVNQSDQSITVRSGKGAKARTLFPHPDCLASVRVWMRERGECRHAFLLDFDHSRRLGDQGLRSLLEEIKAAAGLRGARNVLPHSIRHNCASRLLARHVDLESIRVFLGHSDISTTAVYLHTSEQRLRAIAGETGIAQREMAVEAALVEEIGERAAVRDRTKALEERSRAVIERDRTADARERPAPAWRKR